MKSKALIGGFVALGIIAAAIFLCARAGSYINDKLSELNPDAPTSAPTEPTVPPLTPSLKADHIALGNPTNAAANASNPDNFFMLKEGYALSYNRSKGIPNWVSWRLSGSDFGDVDRQNNYRPDELLPTGWTKVLPSDYSRSGFDRGHMCPSADRSNTLEANSETFLMTNFTPQTHSLNAGPWEKLETYSRSLARRDATLYIIAGQYGAQGKIKNKVTIPTNFWKIIVVLQGNTDIRTITKDNRVIAVDMPNVQGIDNANWRDYRTSIQNIEQKTGYKFLTNLPINLQNTLKTVIDNR